MGVGLERKGRGPSKKQGTRAGLAKKRGLVLGSAWLGFFFTGAKGLDQNSGLGSACFGSGRSSLNFFGRPKGSDPVSG